MTRYNKVSLSPSEIPTQRQFDKATVEIKKTSIINVHVNVHVLHSFVPVGLQTFLINFSIESDQHSPHIYSEQSLMEVSIHCKYLPFSVNGCQYASKNTVPDLWLANNITKLFKSHLPRKGERDEHHACMYMYVHVYQYVSENVIKI